MTTIAGTCCCACYHRAGDQRAVLKQLKICLDFKPWIYWSKIAAVCRRGRDIKSGLSEKNSPEMALLLTIIAGADRHIAGVRSDHRRYGFSDGAVRKQRRFHRLFWRLFLKTVGISIVTKTGSRCMPGTPGKQAWPPALSLRALFAALYIALPLFKTVISMIDSLA